MTNKHKTIKRIELMGGLLPKEMGMSQHLDKEQVREKNIYELALKIADFTVTTGKVSSRSLAEALYDAGYRLQHFDVEKITYAEWQLKLIRLIVDERRIIDETGTFLRDEISCVLSDDCDYPKLFKDGETPEDVWQGEIDAIGDSQ